MSEFTLSKIETSGFAGLQLSKKLRSENPSFSFTGITAMAKAVSLTPSYGAYWREVVAIKYGIREREAWQVRNLNFPTCYVQCEFKTLNGKILTVKRTYKNAKTSDFFYEVNGGDKSRDEKKLQTLLRIAPKDFISSVHFVI